MKQNKPCLIRTDYFLKHSKITSYINMPRALHRLTVASSLGHVLIVTGCSEFAYLVNFCFYLLIRFATMKNES